MLGWAIHVASQSTCDGLCRAVVVQSRHRCSSELVLKLHVRRKFSHIVNQPRYVCLALKHLTQCDCNKSGQKAVKPEYAWPSPAYRQRVVDAADVNSGGGGGRGRVGIKDVQQGLEAGVELSQPWSQSMPLLGPPCGHICQQLFLATHPTFTIFFNSQHDAHISIPLVFAGSQRHVGPTKSRAIDRQPSYAFKNGYSGG